MSNVSPEGLLPISGMQTAEEYDAAAAELQSSPAAQAAAARDAAAAEERYAEERERVAGAIAREAEQFGGAVSDYDKAVALAESLYEGCLQSNDSVEDASAFALEQAAKVGSGRQTYDDVVARFSRTSGRGR